ncbi:hypothetical protein G7Y89_g8223 [Cudoniella acicularis]|uniref:Aminotransferase class V domain-containing protein n=1 Tax=Cudoniella acicularis TaxID=354080 RepID=A0A8H4RJS0_9HELO|nr:hypothetical protein G7Y89_g8223 [Cudoniella acicularis]
MGEVSLHVSTKYERIPFGKEMLKHFLFDPEFKNLNHGSFGTFPRVIKEKQREIQDHTEHAPDQFIRYEYPELLDKSRAAAAKLLNVPTETVVFVANATSGVNTILRNLAWHEDGKDEIIFFSTIYGACGKTIDYVCEANRDLVQAREIKLEYPISDADLVSSFKEAIKASRAARKFPRVAIFDTISSLPGVRMPFEELTRICKEHDILSLIDGAHGIGHISLDLSALKPDFFTSNAHKWLFVPRGCAVLYVPIENQHLIRSTLPTSHGFIPKALASGLPNPLPPSSKNAFVTQFEFVGTIDNSNYLVVGEAIKWRKEACGGEEAITNYTHNLVFEGGKHIANVLGTKLLDNDEQTLTKCNLVNVLLPLSSSSASIPGFHAVKAGFETTIVHWLQQTLINDYKTFIAIYEFQGNWYARLSGQVYLDMEDFEWAGQKLKEICERIGKGEYLGKAQEMDVKEMVVGGDLAK